MEVAQLLQHHVQHRWKRQSESDGEQEWLLKHELPTERIIVEWKKRENAISAVPDETVIPKLVEDKIPEAESIVFLDDLDDSQSKGLVSSKTRSNDALLWV